MSKSPITCHVLDSSTGKPAQDVEVTLQEYGQYEGRDDINIFEPIGKGKTDADGRCTTLLPPRDFADAHKLKSGGLYKVVFKTKEYYEKTSRKCFYPWVEITFELSNTDDHYHIPLLISPYSYTTYRGS